MSVWVARGLGLLGTVALVAGSINLLARGAAFPSLKTCTTNYDLIVCNVAIWPPAPWLALGGAVALAISARILLGRKNAAD